MLLEAHKYALYLAVITRIGHVIAQTNPVPIVGMTTGIDQATGELPLRMNVNILEKEGGPMWDLFIRGLDALQNKPEDDERSHFAVAGIHGMPYAPYNGVGPVAGGSGGGYCPHLSPQLISWHRAYLVLYEQVLGDEVKHLALEYTNEDASAYQNASQKFRLPYWDWANDPTLPPCSTYENITVNGPNGELVLHNPLYNYRWQTYPLNTTQFPGQGSMGPVTTRAGDNGFDPDAVDGDLLEVLDSIKDSVYRTFSSSTTYDQMASMAGSGSSFESPHNTIHNSVGGSFSNLDLTAFDSLFMLHHCNLDRLAALWTAINNDTLQVQPYESQGLYATAKGEIITADSPLKPFYQTDGSTFHTGRTMATTEAFGYTYPEISTVGQNHGRKDVIAQINRLYGGLVTARKTTAASMSRRDWFVNVQVERADLPLPCSINVYLGDHFAGRTVLLGMPKTGRAHDELSLFWAVDRLDVDNNDSGVVERALMKDLHFKVFKVFSGEQGDGTTLNAKDIPSLKIEVVGEDVTLPNSESEFPSYSNRTTLTTIFANSRDREPVLPVGPYGPTAPSAVIGGRWTV
ncbi:Di-copper centre-containing protein [Xylariaceae sp. AK1471]|nr:Di-copper centre-containing protein [Xylariaceae sp. AK1471]